MASPSKSPSPEPELAPKETSPTQNPNLTLTQDDQNQPQEQEVPQSPQTLETQNTQNPENSDPNQEDPQLIDQEDQESAGMFISFPPPPTGDLVTSPITNQYRRNPKRKKFGHMKQQAIDKKVQSLLEKLNIVPFSPSKILDFPKHEKLLKRLRLWDFAQIQFDKNVKADLVAQLIVTFDLSKRASYVNGLRILVNRTNLARALKLPMPTKKEKGCVNVVDVVLDLDWEEASEESISFIEEFVSSWILLHEDAWITTTEVRNWMQLIKDGHPEKVDWASLFWHMVENELKQGVQLVDCCYAPHLQYLIKSQREDLVREEPEKVVEFEAEVKEEDEDCGLIESSRGEENLVLDRGESPRGEDNVVFEEENAVSEEANVELTLGGQDIVQKEEIKDLGLMDFEKFKDVEKGHWGFPGKSNTSEPFLQRCSFGENMENMDSGCNEERKEEVEGEVDTDAEEGEEIEEAEDEFGSNLAPNYGSLERDDLNGGDLLQGFENAQLSFCTQGQPPLHEHSSMELIAPRAETHMIMGGPSDFRNSDKRAIDFDQDMLHVNGSNKRMRTDTQWDPKSSDFGFCIGQAQQMMEKAAMIYQVKEQAIQESNTTHQYLLMELQQRNNMIQDLQKVRMEELEKKDKLIFRLERELGFMGNILDGYRKAIKETNKAFFEYRQQFPLPEEPIYRDAGPGGLVLSVMEIEKRRQKQEEEDKLNRLMIEQKFNEACNGYIGLFEKHLHKVEVMNTRLVSFENKVKVLRELSAERKAMETAGLPSSE